MDRKIAAYISNDYGGVTDLVTTEMQERYPDTKYIFTDDLSRQPPKSSRLVAKDAKEQVIGCGFANPYKYDSNFAHITRVFVSSAQRKREKTNNISDWEKLSHALFSSIITFCEKEQYTYLILSTSNPIAQRFYEKHSFVVRPCPSEEPFNNATWMGRLI